MPTTQEPLPFDSLVCAEWRVDERTREIGRLGLADARAALAEAGRRAAERDAARHNRRAA